MKNALVMGSQGTIGAAIVERLKGQYNVKSLSRANTRYHPQELAEQASELEADGGIDLAICCIGTLHSETLAPEKRLSELEADMLSEYYRVNAIIPALCMRAFLPILNRQPADSSVFVCLSAMVGSIGENGLGGWYGYRSSKAALNMLVKTASLELRRTHKRSAVVAMHPGTTRGPLSKPFSSRVDPEKYYSPATSADRIVTLSQSLTSENNGQFLNWDGRQIDW
jgi:NAD(P)-dependent dehydrogenase (short-subunit alcohol dehydrogenase family)